MNCGLRGTGRMVYCMAGILLLGTQMWDILDNLIVAVKCI